MAFKTSDNLNLSYHNWAIESPKAVIALLHGLGEHKMRYAHWAEKFNRSGYAVVGMDMRGHGLSEGKKGFIPDYEQLMSDIDAFLELINGLYPDKKVVLYGHSLGGGQVLTYLIKKKHHLAAVIATGPFITLSFAPNPIIYAIGKFTRGFAPGFTQNNQLNTTSLSRDAAVVKAYNDDPLVHDRLSSALGIDSLEAGKYLNEYKGEIATPTLLLHGREDKITNPDGTISFYNNTTGNRTLKIFPMLYHEIHNEPEQDEVFACIEGWLNQVI